MPNASTLVGSGLGGTNSLQQGDSIPGRKVGFGHMNDLHFPAFSNTSFIMNVTLFYQTDPKLSVLNDIAFSEIYQACGLTGTPQRPMRVEYNANVIMDPLSKIGFKPVFTNTVGVNCPFSRDRINQILDQLGLPPLD